MTYVYSIVRCLPHPRTGEFVNVGAIAGCPGTSDWAIRKVRYPPALIAGQAVMGAAEGFFDRIESDVLNGAAGQHWLEGLVHDHRNVIQLSVPLPIVAESAEDALDLIFSRQIREETND